MSKELYVMAVRQTTRLPPLGLIPIHVMTKTRPIWFHTLPLTYLTHPMSRHLRKPASKSRITLSSGPWGVIHFTRSGNTLLSSRCSTATIHGTNNNVSSNCRKPINGFTSLSLRCLRKPTQCTCTGTTSGYWDTDTESSQTRRAN